MAGNIGQYGCIPRFGPSKNFSLIVLNSFVYCPSFVVLLNAHEVCVKLQIVEMEPISLSYCNFLLDLTCVFVKTRQGYPVYLCLSVNALQNEFMQLIKRCLWLILIDSHFWQLEERNSTHPGGLLAHVADTMCPTRYVFMIRSGLCLTCCFWLVGKIFRCPAGIVNLD